jgi:hypothetical protein
VASRGKVIVGIAVLAASATIACSSGSSGQSVHYATDYPPVPGQDTVPFPAVDPPFVYLPPVGANGEAGIDPSGDPWTRDAEVNDDAADAGIDAPADAALDRDVPGDAPAPSD